MLQKQEIVVSNAPVPLGSYPHALRVGSHVYFSGVGPRQLTNDIPKNPEEQRNAVLENLQLIIEGVRKEIGPHAKFMLEKLNWYVVGGAVSFHSQCAVAGLPPCPCSYSSVEALPGNIVVEVRAHGRVQEEGEGRQKMERLLPAVQISAKKYKGNVQGMLHQGLKDMQDIVKINKWELGNICDLQVDLPDLVANFNEYNKWYAECVRALAYPTRTTFQSKDNTHLILSGVLLRPA